MLVFGGMLQYSISVIAALPRQKLVCCSWSLTGALGVREDILEAVERVKKEFGGAR